MLQHEGYEDALNLTISLCLTYTLCIACVRIWIRRQGFGLDDLVIAVATLLTLANAAASYVALAKGLGTSWANIQEAGTILSLDQATIAGVVTFIIALFLSKCAMLFFLCRITKTPSQLRLYRSCNVVIATLGVVCVLVATAGCQPGSGYYWAFYANRSSCPSQVSRWAAVTAIDVLTELMLLALPIHLVWGLQMPRSKKAMILIAFFVRLPVLGFSFGRNYYTMRLRLADTDPGLGSALVVIWLEVELAMALAASTLSALKAFTESFSSGFGLAFTRNEGSYGMSNVSGQSSRTEKSKSSKSSPSTMQSSGIASRMDSITPNHKEDVEIMVSPVMPEPIEDHALRLRPEPTVEHFTEVSADPFEHYPHRHHEHPAYRHYDNISTGSCSTAGDDLIIVRETAYEVQHDEAPMLPAHLRA